MGTCRSRSRRPRSSVSLFDLLLETLARAEHYQGRAFAVFQMLSDKKLPRLLNIKFFCIANLFVQEFVKNRVFLSFL
jgi:hypothetical protein